MTGWSARAVPGLVGIALALAVYAGPSTAAVIALELDPACDTATTGQATCEVQSDSTVEVTFTLSPGPAETINGYDLEVRWDPDELTLQSTAQLSPDTGTPEPFLEAPSDPTDSRAFVFAVTASETTQLFRMTFVATPGDVNALPDLEWFANGNGLSPLSVVLANPSGASIDFVLPTIPALGDGATGLLVALVALSGVWLAHRRPAAATLCER